MRYGHIRPYVLLFVVVMLMQGISLTSIHAQETVAAVITPIVLSNNSGDASTEWVIQNEKSLILTGFDLSSLNIPVPFKVDAVTISLTRVTSEPVGIIIYEDPNGGSPVDARVIGRTEASVAQPGVARFVLPNPARAETRIIWVGFYLPVGFGFQADTSGASVLTYWAWTPGQDINTDNLDRAAVFGPSDGSAPVNINLGGIARVSAEVSPPVAQSAGFTITTAPLGRQIIGDPATDFSPMEVYPYCGNLYYDREDIGITANGIFALSCRADIDQRIPGEVRNQSRVVEDIGSFGKGGYVYDVFTGNGDTLVGGVGTSVLRVPVTHCMIPNPEHMDTAVVAVAYGAPKQWDILPTMRYSNFICAELTHVGLVTYLIPRSLEETTATLSANLFFLDEPFFKDTSDVPRCGNQTIVQYRVRNDGFQTTPPTTVVIRLVHVRTGTTVTEFGEVFPALIPGTTTDRESQFILPIDFKLEQYRVEVRVDPENHVSETNEADNVVGYTFTLQVNNKCK